MAFADDKEALLNVIRAKDCSEVYVIETAATYEDLLDILFEFANTFDCDPDYLATILSVFDDATLVSQGVYFNKIAANVDNPKWVVASTYTTVTINSGGNYGSVEFAKGSIIQKVYILDDTRVKYFSVGGGSKIEELDVEEGSCIEGLMLKSCDPYFSTITKIREESCIEFFGMDEGSIFNGYVCDTIAWP